MFRQLALGFVAALLAGCSEPASQSDYFDNAGREDLLAGGVRMIEIDTPDGPHKVWTKRTGNNPALKLLLLHGGPAFTHDYFQALDSFLPAAGIEYYYYDQLGAGRSDRPDNDDLWTIPRFVDEVEQVRVALGLDATNFCILGHSWGGILAIEYALAHQDKVKCVIISNMMASIPAYNQYAAEVLAPGFDPDALAEIIALEEAKDYSNPRYMELLTKEHYEKHILRMPADKWPEPVNHAFAMHNPHIYTLIQGPSEFLASSMLENWDRTADLAKITIPALTIGGAYDTMDPKHMEWMAAQMPNGRYLGTSGSHMAFYDDQETYMRGLIGFLKDVE